MLSRVSNFPNFRIHRGPAAVLVCLVILLSGPAAISQETVVEGGEVKLQILESIPSTFEVWQDEPGFTWQVNRQGALQSGEIPYFQGAMALFAAGSPFAPTEGIRPDGGQATEDGANLSLSQSGDELSIRRDLWFDARRGGVRTIDTFTNQAKRAETIRVDYKTSFQAPWQDLHGTEGRILGSKPGSGLGSRDFGVVVKFSKAEGRHDTLFVTSAEKDALRPMLSFASNQRELTFSYDLTLEPGKSAALVHWTVQRNLRMPGDAVDALRPFYQRRQLIDPRVPDETISLVRNFDAQSFPEEGVKPYNLDFLVSLNQVIEALGFNRRGEDILWITPENQLAGEVNPEAVLKVTTEFGERETKIASVAAIQGGAGIGRTPRVFLRDGRVWSGPVTAEKLTIKIAEGWNVEELNPADVSILLMRAGNDDGRPPANAGMFVATRAGNVLAISTESSGETGPVALPFLSPWGEDRIALKELRHLHYANGTAPKFRILREDGSNLTVLLKSGDLELKLASGEKALVPSGAIASAWRAGEILPEGDYMLDDWLEFEDTGLEEEAIPRPACLLLGNNLLTGELKMEELNLVSGSAVTPLDPGEITGIRLSPDSDNDIAPVFEIGLIGGEVLTGRLRERVLFVESREKLWRVPVQHFVAYRGNEK